MVDESRLIYFDVRDGDDLDSQALEVVDSYFKRSFRPSAVPAGAQAKVFPLGLNFEVYPDRRDRYELARVVGRPREIARLPRHYSRMLATYLGLRFRPTVSRIRSSPSPDQAPGVLFLASAWDPDAPGLTERSRTHRASINETRANTMRLLRAELGSRFVGGMIRGAHAVAAYPDVVCDDASLTAKKQYLDLVHRTPICIASMGLHDSNGWKLGEYVASSRAIVSERLGHQVPHGFSEGRNYLAFSDPDGCLEHCVALLEDDAQRQAMMEENSEYYRAHLAPDRLVLSSLLHGSSPDAR